MRLHVTNMQDSSTFDGYRFQHHIPAYRFQHTDSSTFDGCPHFVTDAHTLWCTACRIELKRCSWKRVYAIAAMTQNSSLFDT